MKNNPIALLLTAAALAFAQGPRGPQSGAPAQAGSGLDMSHVQTVEGVVAAVNILYGAQYPSIQIDSKAVKIAPVWYLLARDFELKAGDRLSLTAASPLASADAYLVAITVTNVSTGSTIALRDSNGVPLWRQGGPSAGFRQGPSAYRAPRTGCPVLAPVEAVSGTVEQVTAALGIQMPSLVLKTSDGKVISVKIGPERLLEEADFEIKPGDTLTLKYIVDCTGEAIALEMTDSHGVNIVLRDGVGAPSRNRP